MESSIPNWTKIDIRRAQGIACYAPAGWILNLTDLPNNSPLMPAHPMTNIVQLLPGERIGVANKDWLHATWLPNFAVGMGNIGEHPVNCVPNEKYLVVEHNPNKAFISPMTSLSAQFTLTEAETIAWCIIRNIYRQRLFFRFTQSDQIHPSCTMDIEYHHLGAINLFVDASPVATNEVQEIKGVLRPQEEVRIAYMYPQDPPTIYFELVQASEGLI